MLMEKTDCQELQVLMELKVQQEKTVMMEKTDSQELQEQMELQD